MDAECIIGLDKQTFTFLFGFDFDFEYGLVLNMGLITILFSVYVNGETKFYAKYISNNSRCI